jgi:quercetin dioxygenase-like cupin family protein
MPDPIVDPETSPPCEARAADPLTAQQKQRHLAEPSLCFQLGPEMESLHGDIGWRRDGHSARTLVKHDDLRVVLIALAPGARLEEHTTNARMSIQTIAGAVRVRLGERSVELPIGGLLVLDRLEAHDVEAIEESVILLTLVWPG